MTTNPDRLAQEIAHALSDMDALPLYESYTRKYSEAFLRKLLLRVLSIPERKIKRSRGALFTYLVGQHQQRRQDERDNDDDYEVHYEKQYRPRD